jgi:hypothetical protein
MITNNAEDHWRLLRPAYRELLRVLKPRHPLAIIRGMHYVSHFQEWFGQHDVVMSMALNAIRYSTYATPIVLQSKERRIYPLACHCICGCYQEDCNFLKRFGQDFPCPQPLANMRQLVCLLSKPGDLVLDPFVGSGTTALACEHEGRRWIAGDWWRPYCRLSEMRLEEIRHG